MDGRGESRGKSLLSFSTITLELSILILHLLLPALSYEMIGLKRCRGRVGVGMGVRG